MIHAIQTYQVSLNTWVRDEVLPVLVLTANADVTLKHLLHLSNTGYQSFIGTSLSHLQCNKEAIFT